MKYRKVFVPNPSPRFDASQLREIAEEIVYVCDTPIFDELLGDEFRHRFEGQISKTMRNYDPSKDIIAFFGDAMIFAMMILYASVFLENEEIEQPITIARFSVKSNQYSIRKLELEAMVGGYGWRLTE